MTGGTEGESAFERRARAVLEESVACLDARTRSRLNRARQAALDAAGRRRPSWPRLTLLPVTGVLAAAVLAVVITLFTRGSFGPAAGDSAQPSVEVLDMLADEDGIALMENYDHSFYEWAAAQAEVSGEGSGAPPGAPDGVRGGSEAGGATG